MSERDMMIDLSDSFFNGNINDRLPFPEILQQYCSSVTDIAFDDAFIHGSAPTYDFIQEQVNRLRDIDVTDTLKMEVVEGIAHLLTVHHLCLHEFPAPQTTADVRLAARPTGETLFTDVGNWANILDIVLNKSWERWDRLRSYKLNSQAVHSTATLG